MKKHLLILIIVSVLAFGSIAPVMGSSQTGGDQSQQDEGRVIPSTLTVDSSAYEETGETQDLEYNHITELYKRINGDTNREIVIVYDATDNVTTAAAEYFNVLLGNYLNVSYYGVHNIDELITAIDGIRANQVAIEVFHGLPDEFRVDTDYYTWDVLDSAIDQSNSTHHIIAACFSSSLNRDDNQFKIKGLEKTMDFEVAVPLLSVMSLKYIYDIQGEEPVHAIKFLEEYINQNMDYIVQKIMNPTNILGEKVLRYSPIGLDKIESTLDGLNGYMDSKLYQTINNTLASIVNLLPTEFFGDLLPEGSLDFLKTVSLSLNDFEIGSIQGLKDELYSQDQITLLQKTINSSDYTTNNKDYGNFTIFLKLAFHQIEDTYSYKATTVQFGFQYDSPIWEKQMTIGYVPMLFDLSFSGIFVNEILLDYVAQDPSDPTQVDPGMYVKDTDTGEYTSLVGYVKLAGPENDVTLEAWHGLDVLGIPKWYRAYGVFQLELGAEIGLDYDKLLDRMGHSDGKIRKAVEKITSQVDGLGVGSAKLYLYFTSIKTGIRISAHGHLSLGLDLNTEFEFFGGDLEIELQGEATFNLYISGNIDWDNQGLWLSKLNTYYPRLDWALSMSIEFEFEIGWIEIEIEYDADILELAGLPEKTYFPLGQTPSGGEDDPDYVLANTYAPPSAEDSVFHIDLSFGSVFNKIKTNLVGKIGSITAEAEEVAGTIDDQNPPVVAFATASTEEDSVKLWNGDGTAKVNDIDLVTSTGSSDYESGDTIDRSLMDNGGVTLQSNESTPIPLTGDGASVKIYTFDPHTGDNTDSEVARVTAKAEFSKTTQDLGVDLQGTSTTNTYSFNPVDVKSKLRIYVDMTLKDRRAFFFDAAGNVIMSLSGYFRQRSFTGWTPWVESTEISVLVQDNDGEVCLDPGTDPDFECPTPVPTGSVKIWRGEIKFQVNWDSNLTINTANYSDLKYGAIFKDSGTHGVSGIGPASQYTDGYEAWWTIEIPLFKFYRKGYIPRTGWIDISVTAFDTAGLASTAQKSYYYELPRDMLAPTISPSSGNLQPLHQNADNSIARTGNQDYDVTITEPVEAYDYYFRYGATESNYEVQTGLQSQSGEELSIWSTTSHAIQLTGSGTSNGFRYWINEPVSEGSSTFTADIKTTNSYVIYLDIRGENNKGLKYLTYTSGFASGDPYESNGYVYLPTGHFNLNDGNWSRFAVNVQDDIQKVFPDGEIYEINGFLIRGTAKIDDIMVDGNVVHDAEDGGLSSWHVYDTSPTGATIDNVEILKPVEINPTHNWEKLYETYDSKGQIQELKYRLHLDTSILSTGEYFITTTAYDHAGLGGGEQFRFMVDHQNPHNPSDITSFGVSEVLDCTVGDDLKPCETDYRVNIGFDGAADNYGISHLKVMLGSSTMATKSPSSSIYLNTFETSGGYDGWWKIVAYDHAGNSITGNSVYVSSSRDADSDGLKDWEEQLTHGTSYNNPDTDGDGYDDGYEVDNGMDPLIQNIPPSVDINIADGSRHNGYVLIDPSISDSDGIDWVKFIIDGDLKDTDYSASAEYNWNSNSVNDGSVLIQVVVKDSMGDQTTESITITVDNSGPSGSISVPGAVKGGVYFDGSASDGAGVDRIYMYVDGSHKKTVYSSSFSWYWDTNYYSEGSHTLKILMYDDLGNSNEVTKSVIVDRTAPSVTITSPSDGARIVSSVTISASASDSHSGVDRVKFYVSGGYLGSDSTPSYTKYWNIDNYYSGSHTIKVVAVDEAGNTASYTISVTIPSIIINPF